MIEKIETRDGNIARVKFHCLGCGWFVKNKRWYVSYNGWCNVQRVSYTCSSCGECDWPLT